MKLASHYRLLLRVIAIVAVIVAAKAAAHNLNWEALSVNPLFTGIVAANVFLMGFLLSGVLSDYKESERIPGELSACSGEHGHRSVRHRDEQVRPDVRPCLVHLSELGDGIVDWLHKKIETAELLERVNGLTGQLAASSASTQVSYVVRIKQEQSNLRRTLTRIDTIRETSFVSAGYLLADIITGPAVCRVWCCVNQEPFYESLLFTGVISCLLIFLSLLIRDLDNPFGYYESSSGADVTPQATAGHVGPAKRARESWSETSPGKVAANFDADAGQALPAQADHQFPQEQTDFVKAVLVGLRDLEEGREMSLADAKRRLLILPDEDA